MILHDATEAGQKTLKPSRRTGSGAHPAGCQRRPRDRQPAQRPTHSPPAHGAGIEEAEIFPVTQSGSFAHPLTDSVRREHARTWPPSWTNIFPSPRVRSTGWITLSPSFLQAIRPTRLQIKDHHVERCGALKTLELLAAELDNRGHYRENQLARQLPATPIIRRRCSRRL